MREVAARAGPLALALFAGAAASGLLGACTPKNPLAASPSVQVAAGETTDGAVAVSRWAEAYAKSPQDPRVAVGYARALKGIGSKDKAFDVLKTAHQRDRDNVELASELGRLALDIGRLEVAKASLEASARYLAADLGPAKIRVNCISAGPVQTLAARGIAGFTDMLKHYEAHAPMQRSCEPAELGATGVFLASDASASITGQVIYVDGGYSIMGM